MPRPVVIANRKAGGLWWRIPLATLLWSIFAGPIIVSFIIVGVIRDHARGLPMAPDLVAWLEDAPRSNLILAADDTLLAELPFYRDGQSGHRRVVPYEDFPPLLVQAVLAAEDLRFFAHKGVDTKAVIRAAWENYRAQRVVQGASTITQQLARNLDPDIGKERSLRRKVREALLARRIEKRYSKETIFSAYANFVFLGANSYGFAAAAHSYFSKSLGELSLAECALLAGLIQIPGRANPYREPALAVERRNVILDRMLRAGLIDQEQHRLATDSELELRPPVQIYGSIAPWATEAVRKEAEEIMPRAFARGGLRIETSIQPALMTQSERLLAEGVAQIKNKDQQSPELGSLLIDHQSRYVEALVGGVSWSHSKFNRATQSCRQPGSAFKPIVYGAALEAGAITPASALRDGPISEYDPRLQVYWKPTNSGREFRGVAIAQDALASSLNTPAVDVYDRVGGKKVVEFAKRMGITSPLRQLRPLALGSSCVKPVNLASFYATIARGGRALGTPLLLLSVSDRGRRGMDDTAFFDPQLTATRRLDRLAQVAGIGSEQILSPETAYQLRSMLRDVVRRGTGIAARSLPFQVGGKTGTTNDNTDAWFVGFSARVTAVVWLGHDDPSKGLGRGHDGSHSALPLWKQLVSLAEDSRPSGAVPGAPPEGLQAARIDRDTGLLAPPRAGGAVELYFRTGTAPTETAGGSAKVGRDFGRSSGAF